MSNVSQWRRLWPLLLALLAALLFAAPAGAEFSVSGDWVTIPEGQVRGPLFAAGNNVVINADVDGDVFAAGQTVTINGKVIGDVLAAGQTVRVNGSVTGDVRCAGSDVDVNGEVTGSLSVAAANFRLADGARVGRDVLLLSGNSGLMGTVDRQVVGAGGSVRLHGPVGGDVRLWDVEELKVGPQATIGGKLTYGSPKQAEIAPGAKVAGDVKWERLTPEKPARPAAIDWLGQLIWFAAGVLVWGVLALIFPQLWGHLTETVRQSPWPALGWGLLLLLVTPLAALVFLVTVIGIPLFLTLIMAYVLLLWAAKVIVGDAVGRLLARRFGWDGRVHTILPFLVGFAALILLTKIPVVGGFINVVIACFAFGTVALALYRWRRPTQPAPATAPAG